MLSKSIVLLCVGFGATVHAVHTFLNKGTFPGNWNDSYIDGGSSPTGTIDQVSNVYYPDPIQSTALKFTQTYRPTGYSGLNDRYHAEVHKYNAYKKGDTGFYGFAFRLSSEWQFSPAQGYNLAQFIADFTDLPCEETFMPSSMVWIDGDQLATRVKKGNVCPTKQQEPFEFHNLATVSAGVWHKIVIQASWKDDLTGFYKLWYDGVRVVNHLGNRTTVTDGRPFQFRVGLYANGWHDDHGMRGTQGFRQVWFDEIGMGSEFADADPDQW